jgi:hypothetical protein
MRLATVLVVAACSSTPTATHEPVATSELPHVAFSKLDHGQRLQLMKERVMPTMRPLFVNHDPTKFAAFGCETCHGDGAKTEKFEMPNPKLPRLTFSDMSKFDKRDIDWMKTEVWPTMVKLLDEPAFSPDNPTGFGCGSCHLHD